MTTSVGPPAANGTNMVTFRVGNVWPCAAAAASTAKATPSKYVIHLMGALPELTLRPGPAGTTPRPGARRVPAARQSSL
jgi:hypothetical protein